jgi:O-succinylbenzoic acid--CoA ligase
MTKISTSLTINSKTFTGKQLIEFCSSGLVAAQTGSPEYNLYNFIMNWISDEPAITVKTSGSTGKPKEIELSKDAMIKSAKLTGQFLNLKRGDRALLCLPVDFIAGKMMVVRAFVLGLDLVPVKPDSSPLKNINENFCFAAMTPMQVHNTLENTDGYDKVNNIEKLIIGGGDISGKLLQKIQKLKNKTYHTYGMTETVTHIALKRLNGITPDAIFKALQGVKFEKDDRECLVINAPHISNKKIVTNDIVSLKNRTEFNFIGRFDNVINTGGIKIFPEVAEKKLSGIINSRFIIAGLPDEKLGEKVVLIVETKDNDKDRFEKIISNSSLSRYEKPKDILFIKKFPETENGKIDRNAEKLTE